MGVKLLILLALIVGALYSLHLLAQDYQNISNPKFLWKRHLNSTKKIMRVSVRWKEILQHDSIGCAQSLFCQLGTIHDRNITPFEENLISMLMDVPREKMDILAYEVFNEAFVNGVKSNGYKNSCKKIYYLCPFPIDNLLDLMVFLINKKSVNKNL